MAQRLPSACRKINVGILAFLCVSLLDIAGAASSIRNVKIDGNTAFTSRELIAEMSSRPSLTFSQTILQNDLRAIGDRYRHAGFLDVRTKLAGLDYSNDSSLVDIVVSINEGRQSLVGAITVSGSRLFLEEDVVSHFGTKSGDALDESTLEQDIDELLTRYERAGFPLAQCQVASIVRRAGDGHDSLNVSIAVEEGRRVTIDEIRVQGNRETDPAVVVRETRLKVGETFNPAKVDAIRERLQRLNIFSDVSEPELYMRHNAGGLLIKVREGNTSTFDGVIGYIPSTTTGQSGYVTGLASIAMRNLFGTGRKLSFNWQREDRNSQELGIRYVEPWILGTPVNIGGGFLQRQQDTSYVRRVLDLKSELMISEELSASLLFGSESVIPSADSAASRVFRSATTTYGIELQYDTRDDLYSPTSGVRYTTDYSFGRKRITNIPVAFSTSVKSRATVQRFALDLDVYLSTFLHQVLAFGVHGRELQSGQLEEGEMFRLGGTRTLRGYRENQFIGSRVAWSNTEYRFLMARRSFIYGFVDGGYYLRPADEVRGIPKSDAFKYGYGIGVQLETGLGNLGVSFALGQGDTFATGKIHFGLINDF